MRLQDKVIFITGASRGVGAAVAVAAAKEGAKVVLASKTIDPDPRLPGTLDEVRRDVEAVGGEALIIQLDVRSEEQCQDAIDRAAAHFGRLDGLVNNAGAIHWAPVASWTSKKFDLVTGVNVRGAFLCSKAAIPHLRKQGGTIVMMSPPINPKAAVGKGPYLISKIGMTMLALAIDGEEANVHACALWPITAIQTAATENFKMGSPKEWRKPDILADATIALLAKDPKKTKFRAWLDEEVLAEEGVKDFTHYRCDPTSEPSPMSIALVDPDWRRV